MDADAIAAAAAAIAAAKHDLSLSSALLQQSTSEFPPAVNHVTVKTTRILDQGAGTVVYAGRNDFLAC
jgi:hypothetical protein